jgi:hypothetical protein
MEINRPKDLRCDFQKGSGDIFTASPDFGYAMPRFHYAGEPMADDLCLYQFNQ